jgi:prephenate dehydrogenase
MRVVVVGLGLMGGSLARALNRAGVHGVVGVDINAYALDAALRAEVVHKACTSLAEFSGACDVIVFATPVSATIALIRKHAAQLARTPLVMDLGSVKSSVYDAAIEEGLGSVFVGAHPMCGSERAGFDASRPDLYDGAPVWLVAGDDAPLEEAERFWRTTGVAAIRRIEGRAHDKLIAAVSHLPQVVASVLGGTLATLDIPRERLGPGGRDTTRLAGSSPELWLDILTQNQDALLRPLALYAERLDRMRGALEDGDHALLLQLLTESHEWQQHR